MNRLATATALLFLWPPIFAGQPDKTAKISCSSEALPSYIQRQLGNEFGTWRIQKEEYLSPRAHGSWESEKPLTCPGIAVGHFENAETLSYSVLLVPEKQTDAGYRFLVFNQKTSNANERPLLVDKSDDSGARNYFLHTTSLNKFFDAASRKKFQAHAPDGILLVDSAENEYEVDVYYWSASRYQHSPIDY